MSIRGTLIVEHVETGKSYMVCGQAGEWYLLEGWKGEYVSIPMSACVELAWLMRERDLACDGSQI